MRWRENSNDEEDEKELKDIFDPETQTVDLLRKKATDMKGNQRVRLVDPDCDDEREIKRDYLKVKILETYDECISKNYNAKGEIKSTDKHHSYKPLNSIIDGQRAENSR